MANKAEQKNQARLKREAAQAAAAAAAKRNRNFQILGGVVGVAILAVILVVIISGGDSKKKVGGIGSGGGKGPVAGITETNKLLTGLQQNGYALGDPKAPITILEFLDVQCPFCKAHELDEQPTVIKNVIRPGKALLKMQPIALPQMGEDSEAGRTVLTRLAAKNKAWNFLNLFYWNQGNEATGYVTDSFLQKLATSAGGTTADAAREGDSVTKPKIAAVDKLAQDLGVTGTPTFAIGLTGKPESSYKVVTLTGSGGNAEQIDAAVAALEKSAKLAS